MKFFTVFTALLLGLGYSKEDNKPNVLFVISDDLSYNLGGLGHDVCQTPHLDKFAKSSVAFTRAYTQFPLCAPSRASLFSGQYPATNGVAGNGGLVDPERVTLTKHFQNHGYWAARVSKIYHMGIPVDVVQGTNGGDHEPSWNERYNIMAMESMTPGKIVDYLNPDDPKAFKKERKVWQKAHDSGESYEMIPEARSQFTVTEVADEDEGLLADVMAADKAIELLEERAEDGRPFFLAVGFVRPHFPFIGTESNMAHYDIEEIAYPAFPEDDFDDIPPQAINSKMEFSEYAIRDLRRGYYGSITHMDEQFGRLMAELDRLELRENTIVVFVSDHGYMIGEHSMHKKSKLWEESIHVPLMISVPGMEGGTWCDEFVELVDLYPTLSDLAGLSPDPGAQGLSLLGLMKDPTSTREEKPDAYIQVSKGHGLRTGKWAFMWYPPHKKDPEAYMLYDMEKDPKQFTNLAKNPEYADVVAKLKTRLQERVAVAAGE
ncbi:MAG: sulfatase [Verrucomicrobiota bacterium]